VLDVIAELPACTSGGMKRLLRFRLRTLLVAVTAVSLYLGWHVHSTETQKTAVNAIRDLGGWVYYDFQIVNDQYDPKAVSCVPERLRTRLGYDFFHSIVHVNLVYNKDGPRRLDNSQTSDAALEYVGQLSRAEVVLLKEGQATDKNLHHLGKLKRLRRLHMWDAWQVSDEGIRQLRNLRNLKYVHCSNAQLGDESLRIFATMPQIEVLSLQGNHFTDKGLEYLAALPNLETLWMGVGSTRITDAGLEHIEKFKSLQRLEIQLSPISIHGLTHLLEGNPNLRVCHEFTANGLSRKIASSRKNRAN
jgi:hypothetical protein